MEVGETRSMVVLKISCVVMEKLLLIANIAKDPKCNAVQCAKYALTTHPVTHYRTTILIRIIDLMRYL